MGEAALKLDERYTYRDYAAWPDDERWELIDGIAYAMGAPSVEHQRLLRKLSVAFDFFFRDKPCEPLFAPVDVLLSDDEKLDDEEVDTVVQPDLLVFCDKAKDREKFIRNAPDLTLEILSPSSLKKDFRLKFERYRRAGVREYWIVDPAHRMVIVHALRADGSYDDGECFGYEPTWSRTAASKIFPGLEIPLENLFVPPPPLN